jgi:hypothetical protein
MERNFCEEDHTMKKLLGIAAAALISTQSWAGPIWGQWVAGGTACNNYNVQAIENGTSLAVLFDEFYLNMPQHDFGDGTTVRKTCSFRIQLTPPSGMYLARMRQVYRGGVMKSYNSQGQLNIRYNIGSVVGTPAAVIFRRGEAISASSPLSNFAKTYQNDLLVRNCGGRTTYGINMTLSGQRSSTGEFLVAGVDSVDADFTQRLELIPEWAYCY